MTITNPSRASSRPRRVHHRTGAGASINPDHVGWHRAILAGVLASLLAAVAVSWAGLTAVGQWQGLAAEWRWLTPLMIDVPLVVLTLARGALRKRGIRTPGLLIGILALTVYSSTANLLHSIADADLGTIETWVGAFTNALAPWLILSMTEVLWIVVTKPIRPRPARRRTAKAKSSQRTKTVQPTLADIQIEAAAA